MKKMFLVTVSAITFLFIAGISTQLRAGWYVAPMAGYVIQNEDGADGRLGYGIQAGKSILGKLDLGLYALFTSLEDDSCGWTMKIKDNFALFAVNFHPPITGLYAGVRVGMADRRGRDLLGKDSGSFAAAGLGYGAEIGYERKLLPVLTLGAGVSYLYAGEAEQTVKSGSSTTTVTFNSTSFINILGSVRLSF